MPKLDKQIFGKNRQMCNFLSRTGPNEKIRGLVSKETVVLHWLGVEMNVWFFNNVDNVR